jgi:hypothetical protein
MISHVPFRTLAITYFLIRMLLAFLEHLLWFTFLSKCIWPLMFFLEPWLWFPTLSKCAWP